MVRAIRPRVHHSVSPDSWMVRRTVIQTGREADFLKLGNRFHPFSLGKIDILNVVVKWGTEGRPTLAVGVSECILFKKGLEGCPLQRRTPCATNR